jgi:hypothetical protein
MARWSRIVNRVRTKFSARGKHLHVCPDCFDGFVYPVTWTESGDDSWWLLLRCGGCGVWRDVVASNEAVAAFDRVLDEGIESISAEADRLERDALAEQADAFAKALDLDLLGAEDFGSARR